MLLMESQVLWSTLGKLEDIWVDRNRNDSLRKGTLNLEEKEALGTKQA